MLSFLTTWNILSAYVVSLVAFVVVYIVLRTTGFFSGRKCVSMARLAGKGERARGDVVLGTPV